MNFIQQTSRYDHKGKARHYQRTYEYRDEQGVIQWNCDVPGVLPDSFAVIQNDTFVAVMTMLDVHDITGAASSG